jgi:hypothetical protein
MSKDKTKQPRQSITIMVDDIHIEHIDEYCGLVGIEKRGPALRRLFDCNFGDILKIERAKQHINKLSDHRQTA